MLFTKIVPGGNDVSRTSRQAAPVLMTCALYDAAEHRALDGAPWSETVARGAIADIAVDAIHAYRGPRDLWPNAVGRFPSEFGEDRSYRNVYLGAAGTAWALHRLAEDELAPAMDGLDELAQHLHADLLDDPDIHDAGVNEARAAPSLLFGESGVLVALEAMGAPGVDARHDALARRIAINAHNPSQDRAWGSPGSMVAAERMWRATGDPRWQTLWRDGAEWLLSQWDELTWTSTLNGTTLRSAASVTLSPVGAGHGFAGNAASLLAGIDLLGDDHPGLIDRVAKTAQALAVREGDLAQWPVLANAEWIPTRRDRRVQWCNGAPGVVICLEGLPPDPTTDELLTAGGELTWRAGAVRRSVGLCHGTAGNGFALLAVLRRTGDERWLHRARCFAMDALADVSARRAHGVGGHHSLFIGDLGVALLLRACLDGEGRFPFFDDALDVR